MSFADRDAQIRLGAGRIAVGNLRAFTNPLLDHGDIVRRGLLLDILRGHVVIIRGSNHVEERAIVGVARCHPCQNASLGVEAGAA